MYRLINVPLFLLPWLISFFPCIISRIVTNSFNKVISKYVFVNEKKFEVADNALYFE
jgi:hypothetical protein